MKYAVIDLAWLESHGLKPLPEWRESVDGTQYIVHDNWLAPYGNEEARRYEFDSDELRELLESAEWTYPEGEEPEINRDLSRILALDRLTGEVDSSIQTMRFTDEEKLQVKKHYPEWEAGIDVKKGECYNFGDDLWEAMQDHTTQEGWEPSIDTASLWERIDEEHAGTLEDPIPYAPPMELFNGKYYTQDGVKYLCNRDSGQALSYNLAELVGLYVEVSE